MDKILAIQIGNAKFEAEWKLRKLWWKLKFYYKKHFVNDGIVRNHKPDNLSDVAYYPEQKLYFDGSDTGVWTQEEIDAGDYRPASTS